MHNGAFSTLPEVITFYNSGGGKDLRKDPLLLPLHLGDVDQADLLAFLESLTGELPEVKRPELPE